MNDVTTIYILGLDPLSRLTPLDGILRSLKRVSSHHIRIAGIAENPRHSGVILTSLFDEVILLETSPQTRWREIARTIRSRSAGTSTLLFTCAEDVFEASSQSHLPGGITGTGRLIPSPLQSELIRKGCLSFPDGAGIASVPWSPLFDPEELDGMVSELSFPVMIVSRDRQLRWIVEGEYALEAVTARMFSEGADMLLIRPWKKESSVQVAVLHLPDAPPRVAGMVREISLNPEDEPWMFVTIGDKRLRDTALTAARFLNIPGVSTLHFILSHNTYLLDYITPLLPVWSDLAAESGANIVWNLVSAAVGHRVSVQEAVPGKMIVFNSFDTPITTDDWLKICGNGGYRHDPDKSI